MKRGRGIVRRSTYAHLFLIALVCLPVTAFAHAKLLRSEPKAHSQVQEAPRLVELWFNEKLQSGFNSIEVKDQHGKRVDRVEVSLTEGNKKAQVELEGLAGGTYTVVWKVLSTDEHTINGQFNFIVPEGIAASASPAQGQQPVTPGAQQAAPPERVESAMVGGGGDEISVGRSTVRWLSYLAMMTIFGGFAFYLLVLAPALGKVHGSDEAGNTASGRRIIRLISAAVVLLIATSFLALIAQASAVFGKSFLESISRSLLTQVITRTGYGGHWLLQILAAAALSVNVLILSSRLKRDSSSSHTVLWWVGLVAAAILLIAPSWTGHATASAKNYRLAIVADWLHLIAGGFWVGGLFHLALTVRTVLDWRNGMDHTRALHSIISRFTRIALTAVGLLALTGVYNAWIHVESFSALWSTAYGKTLLTKLLFVALMLVLGGVNNLYFGRRFARLSEAATIDLSEREKLSRSFSPSVALEATLGVMILLVTSILVFLAPARHAGMSTTETTQPSINTYMRAPKN